MDKDIILRLEELEQDVKLLKAKNEIQNLMGHFGVLHNQKNMHLHPVDFAMTMPDVSVQIAGSELFYGPEGVRRLFCDIYRQEEEQYKGIMLIHYLTTPMIEVAKDGKTARGVWWTPGIETIKRQIGGEPEAAWCFGGYANDFVLENGVWKIWHMRYMGISKCSYSQGWVRGADYDPTAPQSKKRTVTDISYSKEYIQEAIPMTPKPYETWNEDEWYLA